MPTSVVVRRVRPEDIPAVTVLDATVRREMARDEMISLMTRMARHPWPYCLLATTWGAICLLTKLTGLPSLSLALVVVTAEEALRLNAFWRQINHLFVAAADVLNAHTFYSGPKKAFFVADADGEVVGSLALHPRSPDTDDQAKLLRLVVHPSHRLYGVASRLLQEAAAEARQMGFKSIVIRTHTTNTKAVKCYCRNGYKEVEATNFARFYPHRMDAVLLRLELL